MRTGIPLVLVGAIAMASCSGAGAGTGQPSTAVSPSPSPSPSPSMSQTPSLSASPLRAPRPTSSARPAAPTPDELAGVVGRTVPDEGTGDLVVVPGSVPAPGPGPVRTVRVEVEGGLPVVPQSFAAFVLATLNDERSWSHGAANSFARTDGDADIRVVLASPELSQRLCAPLQTGGTLSCARGSTAVITHHRWVLGHEGYADDPTGYRQYVVNHEVGHVLGEDHVDCPGDGEPAPVMQQQTKGLDGCAPNPWPY